MALDPGELRDLRERAKELRCLYRVDRALSQRQQPPHAVFREVLEAIPDGWQAPEITSARIQYLGRSYATARFAPTNASLRSPIRLWETDVGSIEVAYAAFDAAPDRAPPAFLPEERALLDTIARRIGDYLEWKHQELIGERIGAAGEHWRWRERFAERLAASIDPTRWGVERVFLIGSAQSGSAGPGSDIDLVIVFRGTPAQREGLQLWLEGWSLCLAAVAHEHTGLQAEGGLLDAHFAEQAPTEENARELSIGRAG